jgi:hypothetical protein
MIINIKVKLVMEVTNILIQLKNIKIKFKISSDYNNNKVTNLALTYGKNNLINVAIIKNKYSTWFSLVHNYKFLYLFKNKIENYYYNKYLFVTIFLKFL